MSHKPGKNEIGEPLPEQRQITRRKRFVKIIREAKRTLKFSPEERKLVIELAKMIERNNEPNT